MRAVCGLSLVVIFAQVVPAFAQLGGAGGGGIGGIYVDAKGVMRAADLKNPKAVKLTENKQDLLARKDLRKISLRDLDRRLRSILDARETIPDDIQNLAGMVKVEYVVLDSDTRDVYIAGPAEEYKTSKDGGHGVPSGRPTVQLDDLVSAFRCVLDGPGEIYCSIDPQTDGLAAVNKFMKTLQPSDKKAAEADAKKAADLLGLQQVVTRGVPNGSRFARVMIEADYRMKRMAIGLEPVAGLTNHLDTLVDLSQQGQTHFPLARWWFSPKYDPCFRNAAGTVFQLRGPGVELLNEAVMVDKTGNRQGTGKSSDDWDRFSKGFSAKFAQMEAKFPIYADLHNLFDLMMVAAIVQRQRAGEWLADTIFLDANAYAIPVGPQATFAEPIASGRYHFQKVNQNQKRNYITVAFGGVMMRPANVLGSEAGAEGSLAALAPGQGDSSAPAPAPNTATSASAADTAASPTKSPAAAAKPESKETATAKVDKPDDRKWWSDIKIDLK